MERGSMKSLIFILVVLVASANVKANEVNDVSAFNVYLNEWATKSYSQVLNGVDDNFNLPADFFKCEVTKEHGQNSAPSQMHCEPNMNIAVKGAHASYQVEPVLCMSPSILTTCQKIVMELDLKLSWYQNYDQYGNYTTCDYQWGVGSSGGFVNFDFVKVAVRNAVTDKFLISEFVEAPKDFVPTAFSRVGQCE